MRAVVVDKWTEPADLELREVPEPELRSGCVKLEVRAAGCNFFDILLVRGQYQVKPAFPFTPGSDVAGVVLETASDVEGLAPGDSVFGALPFGAYAERVVAPAALLRRVPQGMSFDEAAAFPIVYPTSYAALVFRANLCAGETLLVHAAAGGVGSAALQIGKALGARVIGTAGGADKLEVLRGLGADLAIDYRKDDFVAAVQEATEGRGADVIYDPVGGDVFDRSLKCIAWNGRALVIGFASGRIPEIKANRILLKNIAVSGLHWGAYPAHEPERVEQVFAALAELYARGAIPPLIFARYPLEQLPEALRVLAERESYGKLIVHP